MFKFIISLLIFPVLVLLVLDGIAAGICKWIVSGGFPARNPPCIRPRPRLIS